MTTLETLAALKAALLAIKVPTQGGAADETLFEVVELYANQHIGQALQDLIITKKRVCFIVPTGVHREFTSSVAAISALGQKHMEIALVYSDVAYFKGEQKVAFGAEKNLGLFVFDELIEAALLGLKLDDHDLGGIMLGDSTPISLSTAEQKTAPGRGAQLIELHIPLGLIVAAVG